MAAWRYLRPGVAVLWRAPGASQVGIDPRCAVVLDDLDPLQQALLEQLPRLGGEPELNAYARTLGVGRAPVRELLDRLEELGYLVSGYPTSDTPDDRYWHLAAIAGHARPGQRSAASVLVRGLDQLGLRIAQILAQAGIGRVVPDDDRPVTLDDLGGGGYRTHDLGRPRRERALTLLRGTSPMTALTAPAAVPPDLVVLVEHGAVDAVRVRPLMRDDVAHLPVLVRELDVVVGPLVRPGAGPCLRCLDLHRRDEDPRWPAVATQITASPPDGVETSLGWLGAALAAHQVLAVVDGRGVLVAGTSLEVSATYPLPRYREWAVHPDCGCTRPAEHDDAAAAPVGRPGGVS
ncbi:thiamine biosynthesis protein ThiF [Pseudactinotalea suaedae]|uniref:thiamine biosynthesis protein ThiF n=1 Tax=Pseudactinotalea suaedae TaxID=1524924 RepID=UPI0012E21916|nr:thiamine biosynthesis protein ThiF [Pseudactinotalea suaedae]